MARITSKQAKEMNEAYAKVYQNLQEGRLKDDPRVKALLNTKEKVGLNSGEKVTIEKGEVTDRQTSTNNNTKTPVKTQTTQTPVTQSKQSTPTKDTSQGQLDAKSTHNTGGVPQAAANLDKIASSGPGSGSVKVDGKALMNKLRADSGDKVQSSDGQQPSGNQSSGNQSTPGVNRSQTVVRDGNRTTTTTRTSADSTTKEGDAAVQDFKANREERLNRLRRGGGLRPDGQGPSTGGTPPSTQSGSQKPAPQSGGQKPGLMGRLGSLAGKAVGAARNVAGNVKQGAQAVAGGIKQGAQAVSGALANKGPIQGRQTGAQRRAQQTGQPAPQAQQARPAPQAQQARPAPQAQPAQQARPAPQAQPAQQAKPVQAAPVAKPVPQAQPTPQAQPAQQQQSQRPSPMERRNARLAAQKNNRNPLKRPGAQRAMQMAKARLAASYDLFDDTVEFLVSEGHAKDKSEAMSIMSESEFIDAFNQELNG